MDTINDDFWSKAAENLKTRKDVVDAVRKIHIKKIIDNMSDEEFIDFKNLLAATLYLCCPDNVTETECNWYGNCLQCWLDQAHIRETTNDT